MNIDMVIGGLGLGPEVMRACNTLGVATVSDLHLLDLEKDMPWLASQGMNYVTIRKMMCFNENGKATELGRRAAEEPKQVTWAENHQLSPVRNKESRVHNTPHSTADRMSIATVNPKPFRGPALYFSNDHPFLSPISLHPIRLREIVWPTSMHYMEAIRYDGTNYVELLRKINDPLTMLDASRKIEQFAKVKDHSEGIYLLREALQAKYTQQPDIRTMLVDTGDLELVYATPDPIWGIGESGDGGNVFGKTLEAIRTACVRGELPRSRDPPPEIDKDMCNVCSRYPQAPGATWCEYCISHVQQGSVDSVAAVLPRDQRPEYPVAPVLCNKCGQYPANLGYAWCQTCFIRQRSIVYGNCEYINR